MLAKEQHSVGGRDFELEIKAADLGRFRSHENLILRDYCKECPLDKRGNTMEKYADEISGRIINGKLLITTSLRTTNQRSTLSKNRRLVVNE